MLEDIRKMLAELGLTSADFSANLPDRYGRKQTVYLLPKRETLILIAGYSIPIRARIIDRWMELEAEAQSRGAAYTADQQAMPMPELFAQLMQQQAETSRVLAETQRMLAGLLTAPKETEVKKDGRLISAREARAEFGLSAPASEIGIRSTEYCQAHGIRYYQRRNDQGVNKYPAWVITELFVSA